MRHLDDEVHNIIGLECVGQEGPARTSRLPIIYGGVSSASELKSTHADSEILPLSICPAWRITNEVEFVDHRE